MDSFSSTHKDGESAIRTLTDRVPSAVEKQAYPPSSAFACAPPKRQSSIKRRPKRFFRGSSRSRGRPLRLRDF